MIKPEDLIIKTHEAARITGQMFVPSQSKGITVLHKPTGIEASCEAFRSQHHNKDDCMKQLRVLLQGVED